MSQRNSGEMTESYGTYLRRHIYSFMAGLIFGWVTLAVGAYTDLYQQAASATLNYSVANPLVPLSIIGVSALTLFVYSKVSKYKANGGDKKK
jgi:hypothetical protein